MPVEDHLSPAQSIEVNKILSGVDPDLARAVSLQLASDPVAIELSRIRAEVGSELRGLTDGMRGELRGLTDGVRDELRAFRWQMLGLVALAMVLNTALVGVGVAGRFGTTEIEVNPARRKSPTSVATPSPVVRPLPPPSPLAEPLRW